MKLKTQDGAQFSLVNLSISSQYTTYTKSSTLYFVDSPPPNSEIWKFFIDIKKKFKLVYFLVYRHFKPAKCKENSIVDFLLFTRI